MKFTINKIVNLALKSTLLYSKGIFDRSYSYSESSLLYFMGGKAQISAS